MKKLFLISFLLISLTIQGQNFQLHYDLGQGRKHMTSTFEMFKPDTWGDTFFFVDMEFNGDVPSANNINEKQPSLAYMEIARCFKFWKAPISIQLEYNGGLMLGKAANAFYNEGYFIQNAYLGGIDYAWHNPDFTKFLNLKILFKSIQGKNPASFQLSGVWNLNYLRNKLTLSGFADFWREDNLNFTDARGQVLAIPTQTRFVFLTEPQIWYNLNKNLSVGGEVEIGANFGTVDGLKVSPAFGAKWSF